jgi:DNA modification methylase
MTVRILQGDCRDVLKTLPDESVHCVVTSPPYWGLRDYGVSGQLGLESTPQEYIEKMVAVFREVRRVLRSDGTLWLNMGDCYTSGGRDSFGTWAPDSKQATHTAIKDAKRAPQPVGLKPKDLVGIPWRLAFALRADGWCLRQEIIWAKPNPMPESVRDRCTKSHEQLFLFAKAKWGGPQGGRFADVSDADARWLALCIDTEDCIVVKRVKQLDGGADSFSPQVSFGSTSRVLMERFVAIVGHGSIAERPGKNAPMWCWQVGNNIARDFLHLIYDHLIVKQRQARIGIYVDDLVYFRGGKLPVRKQRSEAENNLLLSLWSRNKECNRFGSPDLGDVPEPKFGGWRDCERYYFDSTGIQEPCSSGYDPDDAKAPDGWDTGEGGHGTIHRLGREKGKSGNKARKPASARGVPMRKDQTPHAGMAIQSGPASQVSHHPTNGAVAGSVPWEGTTRNKRSVWTVTTQPFKDAHFATFPPALIEPCILAGCPAQCCSRCGAPSVRETTRGVDAREVEESGIDRFGDGTAGTHRKIGSAYQAWLEKNPKITTGWTRSCKCEAEIKPGTVLDPFGGAGTTGLVADRLGRDAILIELNPMYVDMARKRIVGDAPLFAEVA